MPLAAYLTNFRLDSFNALTVILCGSENLQTS